MSYYYNYTFVTPAATFAIVKEELKSYFDTGAVDDLMFPTYLDKCLKKLGRATYPIKEVPLMLEGFQARLPDNFYAVREAWRCIELNEVYPGPNSFYSQATASTTIQIVPIVTNDPPCVVPGCMPDVVYGVLDIVDPALYKTNYADIRTYQQSYLLKPGNISARESCDLEYTDSWKVYGQSPGSSTIDSFDIRDNKFMTNFNVGVVHLIYYATDFDECGEQLIPDNYRIKEYVEAFIKYKVFEVLTNQTNDETFNQLQQKLVYYKQLSDEAFIMADIEIKKQTMWSKQRAIKRDLNRLREYGLRNSRYRRQNNY